MRHHRSRVGDGTAWLVSDRLETAGFHCYWYTGRAGDHLVEHAHVGDATEAVAWGRRRTPRVRIRTADARTSWAGARHVPLGSPTRGLRPTHLQADRRRLPPDAAEAQNVRLV